MATLMEFMGMGGKGMAEQAANTLADTNAYKKYAIEAQSNGEKPMTKEEYILGLRASQGGLLARN